MARDGNAETGDLALDNQSPKITFEIVADLSVEFTDRQSLADGKETGKGFRILVGHIRHKIHLGSIWSADRWILTLWRSTSPFIPCLA